MIENIPTAQKMKFPLRISSVNMDLVTFTEEILNGKLHFLCSVKIKALNIYHASFMWKTFLLEGYKIGDSKF